MNILKQNPVIYYFATVFIGEYPDHSASFEEDNTEFGAFCW